MERRRVDLRIGKRVLVVDDHADTADVIGILLRRLGHVVRTAYRGRDAIEVATELVPECAIIDLQLPDINGRVVARYLREHFRPVTLIALSGRRHRSEDDVEDGFDRHLLKPIDAITLSHLVEGDDVTRR